MVTLNEYERRLLLIADRLESIQPNRFFFGTWVGMDWAGKEDLSCGTTACALGWGTTVPELRALGLRLFKGNHVWSVPTIGVVRADGAESEDVAALFDLTDEEFEFLFIPAVDQSYEASEEQVALYGRQSPDSKASPQEVAKHIRDFVQFKYHNG